MPRRKMTEEEKAAAKAKREAAKGVVQEEPDTLYHLTLTVNGEVFEGEGKTPVEALDALMPPHKLLAKGVLEVRYKEAYKKMNLVPHQLIRLFWPNTRVIQAKIITSGLK